MVKRNTVRTCDIHLASHLTLRGRLKSAHDDISREQHVYPVNQLRDPDTPPPKRYIIIQLRDNK